MQWKPNDGLAQTPEARKEETGGERSNRPPRVSYFASLTFFVAAIEVVLGISSTPVFAETFFASEVVEFAPGVGITPGQGFGMVERILGGPRGAGRSAGSLDVLTLGVGGSVTIGFDGPTVQRHIVNARGPDFIVSENAFFVAGDEHRSFGELAYVEVSSDGVNFARFPSRSLTANPVTAFGSIDPADVFGLSGSLPTLANVDSNTNNPFDPMEAGGNAFDLAELSDDPLVIAGSVELQRIRFVRIMDILGDGSRLDSDGHPIYDPTGFSNSCDIDAIAVIHGCTAGDYNGDGKRESDDIVELVEALLQDKAQNDCADANADGVIDGDDIQAFVAAWAS